MIMNRNGFGIWDFIFLCKSHIFIQYINRKDSSSVPLIIKSLIGGNQPESLGKKLPKEL